MNKKKLLLIGGGILALLVLIIIISSILSKGNGGQVVNPTGSYVTSMVFAKGEDENKNPLGVTDVFSVNDSEIHMVTTYLGLPANSIITYQWYDLKNNKILKEDKRPQLKADFSGTSSSVLLRDDQTNWDVGTFSFVILLNNKKYFSQNFSVKTDLEIQKEQIRAGIKSIVLTSGVDLLGKPTKNETNVFSKDDEDIFASVVFQDIPIDVEMTGRWEYIAGDRLINIYKTNLIKSGTFAFGINSKRDSWLPTQKWQVGHYRLRVYLNGDLFKDLEFEIK